MDAYQALLGAAIGHLEDLKRGGRRFLAVSPETLNRLTATPAPAASAKLVRDAASANVSPARSNAPERVAKSPAPGPRRPAPSAPVPAASMPSTPLTWTEGVSKAQAIEEIRARAMVCVKCPNLASSRKNVVWGVGSIDAELMFIGEAPGAEEDEQGEPFVGRAGQLLTKIIQTMGLSRETVYIANILKCRPDTPGQDYGNRPPTPKESENCLPYLCAQIDLIKPKAIVALGATAVNGLFGATPGQGITKVRGQWREYRGIPVMLTYHPSYLLRPNPNNVKREVWEDMLQIMERLGLPITDKHRGYFLTPR